MAELMTDLAVPSRPGIGTIASTLAHALIRLPSRMLDRMFERVLHLDSVFEQNLAVVVDEDGRASMGRPATIPPNVREVGLTSLPGPWGFVSSGYFFGLFFMVSTARYSSGRS